MYLDDCEANGYGCPLSATTSNPSVAVIGNYVKPSRCPVPRGARRRSCAKDHPGMVAMPRS
jgi:hypothetical protein